MNTLTADFFPQFLCKCGECRHACCIGWPVNVTMNEYFRLIGVDCSADLRRRLDCGMILRGGGEKEYAFIHHGYTGDCYMRRDDGLCAIQRELGEEILPAICRMYPRSCTLWDDGAKLALANSCEMTVELMLHRAEPISFRELDTDFPTVKMTGTRGTELKYIPKMQDRTLPLNLRIAEATGILPDGDAESTHRAAMILLSLGERSNTASELCASAKEALGTLQKMRDAFDKFGSEDELLFEHLLVNHIFFSSFTDSDIAALSAAYLFLKSVYCGNTHEGDIKTSDLIAEVFRFIEHSPFTKVTNELIKRNELKSSALLNL